MKEATKTYIEPLDHILTTLPCYVLEILDQHIDVPYDLRLLLSHPLLTEGMAQHSLISRMIFLCGKQDPKVPFWITDAILVVLHELLMTLTMGPYVFPNTRINPRELLGSHPYYGAVLLMGLKTYPHLGASRSVQYPRKSGGSP